MSTNMNTNPLWPMRRPEGVQPMGLEEEGADNIFSTWSHFITGNLRNNHTGGCPIESQGEARVWSCGFERVGQILGLNSGDGWLISQRCGL